MSKLADWASKMLSTLPEVRDPIVLQVMPFDHTLCENRDTKEELWISFIRSCEWGWRSLTFSEDIDMRKPQRVMERRLKAFQLEQQALEPIADAVAAWDTDTPAQLAELCAALPSAVQKVIHRAFRRRNPTQREGWIAALNVISDRYWVIPWLHEYMYTFSQMSTQTDLRTLQHYFVAYPESESPESCVQKAQDGFGLPMQVVDHVPPLIADYGDYEEQLDHLAPRYPELPYLAFLVVHAFPPEKAWTIETWRCLFDLDLDVALCIDVETQPRWWQKVRTEHEEAVREQDSGQAQANRDRLAVQKQLGAAAIGDMLAEQQQLHNMRVVIAVKADTLEQLQRHISTITMACSSAMELLHPKGTQQGLARFFDPTPTHEIDAFAPVLHEPSHGVAVTLAFGFKRHSGTEGVWWGSVGSSPLMFDPVSDSRGEKTAGHTIVSGVSGSGKTTAANTWSMRQLALGWQLCFFEPQGHAAKLVDACVKDKAIGAQRHVLGANESMNLLDVAIGRDEFGRPPALAEQSQFVINQMSVVLASAGGGMDGAATTMPRVWTAIETALLEMAIESVYGDWSTKLDQLPPSRAPLVQDLCDALRDLNIESKRARSTRDDLLDEIYYALVVGSKRHQYNRTTSVEWDFERDCVAYDFTKIPAGAARSFTIAKALAAVNTYVRSKERDRERPFANYWDELAVTLRKAPELGPWLEDASRAWRTFRAIVVGLDQHVSTWFEGPLRVMFDQAPLKFIFQQPTSQARQLETIVDGLQPEHVRHIPNQQPGQFTLVRRNTEGMETNEVAVGHVKLTSMEWEAFKGT